MNTNKKNVRKAEPGFSRLINRLVPHALEHITRKRSYRLAGGVKVEDQYFVEALHKKLHRYSKADRDFIIAQVFYAMAVRHPEAIKAGKKLRDARNQFAGFKDRGGALNAKIERDKLRDYLLREQVKKQAVLLSEKL